MAKHRILLVEELVLSDSAEFTVDAETPGEAASQLIRARHAGLDEDCDDVRLSDGQSGEIKPQNVVRSRLFCMLLDDAGNQIDEIEASDPALLYRRAPQPRSFREDGPRSGDAHWIYDPADWEITYAWSDCEQLIDASHLEIGDCRKFATLIDGPKIYAARLPTRFDAEGEIEDAEVQWFHSRADAETAVALAFARSPDPDDAPPLHSPWGAIQDMRFMARGVYHVCTASHGGIKLASRRNALMPDYLRTLDGFYEEDVRWAFVALLFPELFPTTGLDPRRPETTTRVFALALAGHFYPDLVARFLADEAGKQSPPD